MKDTFSSTVKFVASMAMALSMAVKVQAQSSNFAGSGMPTDRCAYNASPQRRYAAPAVAAAETAIADHQKKIDRVEEQIKDIESKDCIKKCKRTISKAIRIVDSRDVEDMYIEHLSCSDQYTSCQTSVSYYNKWASAYGLAQIYNDNNNLSRPNRAIASGTSPNISDRRNCEAAGKHWVNERCIPCAAENWTGSRCVTTNTSTPSQSVRPSPRPSQTNRQPADGSVTCPDGKRDVGGGHCCYPGQEFSGSSCRCVDANHVFRDGACRPYAETPPPAEVVPEPVFDDGGTLPPPAVTVTDSTCQRPGSGNLDSYAQPDCALDLKLCSDANTQGRFSGTDMKNCRYCLIPTSSREDGRYSHCLSQIADLEIELADLEDELQELQDALDEANDDDDGDTEGYICVDCLKDNRGFFERYGPTLAQGLLSAAGVYGAYRQYQDYESDRREIHDNNTRLGFTSDYREDPSIRFGLVNFALGQGVGVLNTAYSTGAFGCTQGNLWGNGGLAGNYPNGSGLGGNTYAQIGGFGGLPAGLLGGINQTGLNSGGIFQQAGGGIGPWGLGNDFNYGAGLPGTFSAAASIFGGGGLGSNFGLNNGVNQNGVNYQQQAESYAILAAQAQANAQAAEARQSAYNDIIALRTQTAAQEQSILAGLGTINGVNTGGFGNTGFGSSGLGVNAGFNINAGFGTTGGAVQTPLLPFGGDPNINPATLIPTNSGIPSGINIPSSSGPAGDIGI